MKVIGLRTALLLLVLAAAVSAAAHADALDDARALLREGRHDAALERLDDHLKNSPDDSTARFLKGVALAEAGRRAQAIDIFSALVEEFPQLPEPYNNLAVLHAAAGDLEKARAYLLEAIRIHPSYAMAHENLGDVYGKMAALSYSKALSFDGANQSARAKRTLAEKLSTMETGDQTVLASRAPAPSVPVTAPTPSVPVTTATAAPAAPSSKTPGFAESVVAAVRSWADAWSSQDVDAYLGHYADSFVPADGRSRESWTILRRKRLSGPQFINLRVARPEVTRIGDNRASVTFEQSYRSDGYADQVVKQLELVRQGGRWKILSERTVE